MNTPTEISSLTEYINQIDEITHPEKKYLYRGQEDEAWRVISSAYRRLVSSSEDLGRAADLPPYSLRYLYQNYLLKIIDEVKLRYPPTYRDLSPLECMAHLQHNRGLAYFSEGELELAIEDLDKAIESNPDYADAYYNRGAVWLQMQQWENAKLDLTVAKIIGKDSIISFQPINKSIVNLEQLRNVNPPEDIAAMLSSPQA